MRIRLPVSSPVRDTPSTRHPTHRRRLCGFANPTVQRAGASRIPQAQIQRHRRLAPVADLGVKSVSSFVMLAAFGVAAFLVAWIVNALVGLLSGERPRDTA